MKFSAFLRFAFRAALIAAICLGAPSTKAQTFTPRTASVNANCKGFYEYLPVNYAASANDFPLLVYCGGAGSLGNGTTAQLARLLTEGTPYYIKNNKFPASVTVNGQDFSFIVIAPQFINWPSPTDVEDVLNYLAAHGYKIDQSRIYLTGFSAGGNAAWKFPNTSVNRSKRLAALVPVAGYNYPYVDTGAKYIAAANLPVWALHSNDDGPAPVTWSQNFVNKINSYNPATRAKITRFGGVTHDDTKLYVYNPTYRSGGFNIYEWMLQYSRDLPPVAKAGTDITITMPVTSATLNGSASYDPEGSAVTYKWQKISGPSRFTLSNATAKSATASNLVSGTYGFELIVTDINSRTGRDTVLVKVINPNPNILPEAAAGKDTTLHLPDNTIALNASASADEDGSIEKYAWSKIAGPSQYTLTGASAAKATASNLAKGAYQFRLTVTDNDGATDTDVIVVTVVSPFPNKAPTANAGNDTTITLPANTAVLNGTASADSDGVVAQYGWEQIDGPSTAVLNNSTAATTQASNLIQGSYRFQLTVQDDSSATAMDTVLVTVLPAPSISTRAIKINLYGGVNPYNTGGWNNWNVTGETNITSGKFNYSDGQASAVNAVLSYSQGVPDNGAGYGGTMCPPQVLRYCSYSTASTRTLSIKGLNNAAKYDLELFASRANTGNKTIFVVKGSSKTVVTDNNKTASAAFADVVPVNGQIIVTINKEGTFTYLNGLIVTEKTATSQSAAATNRRAVAAQSSSIDKATLQVFPNPAGGSVQLTINGAEAGMAWISISNADGKMLQQLAVAASGGVFSKTLHVPQLNAGLYFIRVKINGKTYVQKLYKQ